MKMYKKIFELLPQNDCRRCGRNSCLAFATDVAQGQSCIEFCPEISGEAERALHVIIAAEHNMISWVCGMVSGFSRSDLEKAIGVFKELFLIFPLRVAAVVLFTLPLTYPLIMLALWLYNRW